MPKKPPQPNQAVVPAGERNLTTHSASVLQRGFALLAQRRERVVHFPKEVSLGLLHIRGQGSKQEWTALGEALGEVTVPAGKELWLLVRDKQALTQLQVLYSGDLEVLSISEFTVTDAGLVHVGNLTSLQELWLVGTAVTDAGLVHLGNLTSLQRLWLTRTAVTDAGLVHVGNLTSLQELRLDDTAVTDAGLVHVGNLTSLQELSLDRTAVTDAGLVHVGNLTSLQTLALSYTAVTDAGLVHVGNLTSLQLLWLGNTAVTDAGVASLQLTLPLCSIHVF